MSSIYCDLMVVKLCKTLKMDNVLIISPLTSAYIVVVISPRTSYLYPTIDTVQYGMAYVYCFLLAVIVLLMFSFCSTV